MNYVHAAIGIIINKKKIYITKGKHKKNKWEFPGGKIKKNENIVHALKRELLEEVGIVILKFNFFQYVKYINAKKKLKLYFFLIKKWQSKPYSIEGHSYHWKFLYHLRALDFPPANHNVITSLKNKC